MHRLYDELATWWPELLDRVGAADLAILVADNQARLERSLCRAAGERGAGGRTLAELGWDDARLRLGHDGPEILLHHLPAFAGQLSCAEHDDLAPPEMVAELKGLFDASGARGELEVHMGVHHGFAFPERWCYDVPAAERHWERLFALYRRSLA